MQNEFCPCCGRHCSLNNPNCERGAEYAKTGNIPPRNKDGDGSDAHLGHNRREHGGEHYHGHRGRHGQDKRGEYGGHRNG